MTPAEEPGVTDRKASLIITSWGSCTRLAACRPRNQRDARHPPRSNPTEALSPPETGAQSPRSESNLEALIRPPGAGPELECTTPGHGGAKIVA